MDGELLLYLLPAPPTCGRRPTFSLTSTLTSKSASPPLLRKQGSLCFLSNFSFGSEFCRFCWNGRHCLLWSIMTLPDDKFIQDLLLDLSRHELPAIRPPSIRGSDCDPYGRPRLPPELAGRPPTTTPTAAVEKITLLSLLNEKPKVAPNPDLERHLSGGSPAKRLNSGVIVNPSCSPAKRSNSMEYGPNARATPTLAQMLAEPPLNARQSFPSRARLCSETPQV